MPAIAAPTHRRPGPQNRTETLSTRNPHAGDSSNAATTSYAEGRADNAPAPESTYVVQPGDSLWEIATRVAGDGTRWVRLWAHNRDVLPSRHVLPVGVTLRIPPDLQKSASASPATSESNSARTYIVRGGDNLSRIAARELGDSARWADIWKWNRDKIHNPNHLVAGMKLRMSEPSPQPEGPGAPAEASAASPTPTNTETTVAETPLPGSTDNATTDSATTNNAATTSSPTASAPATQERGENMAPGGPTAVGNTPLERQLAALWNSKGGVIRAEAARLGIETAVAAAVMSVESGGEGFRNGKMVIRFEKHIFRDLTGHNVWVRHTGRQADEYDAFQRAVAINKEAAHDSISMGAAQVMGFNAERIGYSSATEMFEDFMNSETAQLKGMFEFIRTSRGLMRAARNKDWASFAYLYNGPGYAANAYDSKMAAAYSAFNRVMSRLPQQ